MTLSESKTEHPAMNRDVSERWRTALLAGVAALFVAAQLSPADAQFFRQDPPLRKASKAASNPSKRDVPIRHPFGEDLPKGPLQLMVSVGDQRAVLYSNGVRVADTKVSTGTPSHPTPTGIFSIIQKNRWHRSNLYGNAPMFFMHRLTWSGIALHEGHLPGFAASHGCIRMPTDFVSRLWNVSKLGMRVVVARVELAPQDFAHAKLFNPAPKPIENAQRLSETLEVSAHAAPALVRIAAAPPGPNESVIQTDAPAFATDMAAPAAAASSSNEPLTTSTVADDEPARPAIDPRELRLPRPIPLRARAAEPTKLNGQVAVFISGKEKRIFVRHAFVPLFDMPIEIENPEKPLGTHTFTALEVVDDGSRMRWNLVSMPQTATPTVAVASKKAAGPAPQRRPKTVRGAVVTADASNATEALDRVTIPPEAIERIAELLSPGSSLIITDDGLGRETGRYTEFIVETR